METRLSITRAESTYCKNKRFAGKRVPPQETSCHTIVYNVARLQVAEKRVRKITTIKRVNWFHIGVACPISLTNLTYTCVLCTILSRVSQSVQLRHNDRILCNIEQLLCFPSRINLFICRRTEIYIHSSGYFSRTARGMCVGVRRSLHVHERTCVPRSLNFSSLSSLPRFYFPYVHTCHVSFSSLSLALSFSLSLSLSLLQQRQWIKSNVSHATVSVYI